MLRHSSKYHWCIKDGEWRKKMLNWFKKDSNSFKYLNFWIKFFLWKLIPILNKNINLKYQKSDTLKI